MLGEPVDVLFLSDFDKRWKDAYELEKGYLKKILKRYSYMIGHIGSTALGGNLLARPIVDIVIGAHNQYDQIAIRDTLNTYSYTYVPELSSLDSFYFERTINGKTYFTIRVMVYRSYEWQLMQRMHEALFNDSNKRLEYNSVKTELVDTLGKDKIEYVKSLRKFQRNEMIK